MLPSLPFQLAALAVRCRSPRICPRRAPPPAATPLTPLTAAAICPLRARGVGRRSCCHPTRHRWTIRCRRALLPAAHAQLRPLPLRSHCHRRPPRHWRLRCLSWTSMSQRRHQALLPLLLLPTLRLSLQLRCSRAISTVRTTRRWTTWMLMQLRLQQWLRSKISRP